jgi:hypothetical protein
LQAALELPPDVTAERITEALRRLDDVVREVRQHMVAGGGSGAQHGIARMPPPYLPERSALAQRRAALLQQRVARTAHALQFAAADTAALLEQRADLAGQPGRVDCPAEIKRWQALPTWQDNWRNAGGITRPAGDLRPWSRRRPGRMLGE